MGIFNHPVDGERWRTVKWLIRTRYWDLGQFACAAFVFWYWKRHEINRYCSHLNKSALYGGRCKSLEKPELVGVTDMKYLQFQADLDRIIDQGKEKKD